MKCEECRGACCESFIANIQIIPFLIDAQHWLEFHGTPVKLLHHQNEYECRCRKLTSEGKCSIWQRRPLVCRLFTVGSPECLDTVKKRRTSEDYQRIRDEKDPKTLE